MGHYGNAVLLFVFIRNDRIENRKSVRFGLLIVIAGLLPARFILRQS
jgi:hypothetical protein